MYFLYPIHNGALFIIDSNTTDATNEAELITLRAHQTRRSGRNSHPISAEIALPRVQSEIKVAFFHFALFPHFLQTLSDKHFTPFYFR
jgi:hypothetical protein